MFEQTRLKLTAWYLAILLFISISFSIVIYRMLVDELERFVSRQRMRMELRMENPALLPPQMRQLLTDPEIVEETKGRIISNLVLINIVIAAASGGLSYVLAGRTLKPIQDMLDEQYRFTSDASHELRTPLTALKTNLEVHLRDKNLSLNAARKLIGQSLEDVGDLQMLTDSLLELTRSQKSNSDQASQSVKLDKVLTTVINKLNPVAKAKKITIDSSLIKTKIPGTEDAITRLCTIILDNALKYTPPRKTISVRLLEHGSCVECEISDEGIGIAPKDIPHIFDRFYRADSARTKHETNGYGLGLAIAQKIATHHNAKIHVESKLGQGSTFTIKFPKTTA